MFHRLGMLITVLCFFLISEIDRIIAQSWPPPEAVTADTLKNANPAIAINSQGRICVAYTRNYMSSCLLSTTMRDSNGWQAPINIVSGEVIWLKPSLVAGNGDTIWMAMMSAISESLNLGYLPSSCYFDGINWSPLVFVTLDTTKRGGCPTISKDKFGKPWIVWSKSNDNVFATYWSGSSWVNPIAVNSLSGLDVEQSSKIAGDSIGNVWIIWCDVNTFAKYYDGVSWSSKQTIQDNLTSWNSNPLIVVDAIGNIGASWYSDPGGGYISFNNGSGWSLPESLGFTFDDICSDSSGKIWGIYGLNVVYYESSIWSLPFLIDTSSYLLHSGRLAFNPVTNEIWAVWVREGGGYPNIYVSHTNTAVEVEERSEIVKNRGQIRLYQNYPNPFSKKTDIRYQILDSRFQTSDYKLQTSIIIYNVVGQEIRTLVKEPKAPGYYTVTWDGKDNQRRDLMSGIYFCKLQIGDFIATKKITLIR
ncbi:MAG: T9SS type A sorting domain-containing protein [Candidatus Edwardsbacteria bacterium]